MKTKMIALAALVAPAVKSIAMIAIAGLVLCPAANASTFSVSNFGSTFTVTRDDASSAETVHYRTVSLSALAGEHFVEASGTLAFAYGAGWGGSSNVTVAAGATLKVTDTGAATAFARADGGPSIVNLKLEADGESYGKLDLGGNVSVKTLRIGDTFLPAGDYGSTESGARNTNDNHFTGVGVLHVRRSGLISPLHLMIR